MNGCHDLILPKCKLFVYGNNVPIKMYNRYYIKYNVAFIKKFVIHGFKMPRLSIHYTDLNQKFKEPRTIDAIVHFQKPIHKTKIVRDISKNTHFTKYLYLNSDRKKSNKQNLQIVKINFRLVERLDCVIFQFFFLSIITIFFILSILYLYGFVLLAFTISLFLMLVTSTSLCFCRFFFIVEGTPDFIYFFYRFFECG